MENPRTWGPVEKTINTAFVEWDQRGKYESGYSLEMTIANALRQAELISDGPEEGCTYDCSYCHIDEDEDNGNLP